jgi:Gas vesicle synthesis protein GvpL/GvpF
VSDGSALYVYGIVGDDDLPDRLAGRGLRLVGTDGLAALVKEVPAEVTRATRRALLDHAEIVEDAFEWTTILPMRFGVVVPDEDAVSVQLLEPSRDLLEDLLRQHASTAELTLKASYDEEAVLAELVAASPRLAQLRELYNRHPSMDRGMELGEETAAQLTARRDRDADRIVRTVEPLTLAMRVGEVGLEGGVVSLALLVERGRAGEVEEWVKSISRDLSPPIHFRLVGPLPPYSFVDVPLAVPA